MRRKSPDSSYRRRPRGFVLLTMALTTACVFGAVGLALDVGRMFIAKNETQVYCDAAATSAALMLDGTGTGIARATSVVTSSTNKWNFGTTSISTPSVKFATAPTGPWETSPNPATGYAYAQVTSDVSLQMYFLPLLTGQGVSIVTSTAVAGQVPISSVARGVAPYTAVSTNLTGPDFGFVVGNSYTIHWPTFNGNRSGCGIGNPDKCFNSTPCSGDPPASLSAVVANWGSQYHGFWGSNSNSVIAAAVLDGIQLAPLSVGTNLDPFMAPGNKQSEAGYLDQRASQDTDTSDDDPISYLTNSAHNGRRLLAVAIANPVDATHTNVIGFGQFLLHSNGSPSDYYKQNGKGNSPYCATYVGPYNIGSTGPGTGGSTGASYVRLVE